MGIELVHCLSSTSQKLHPLNCPVIPVMRALIVDLPRHLQEHVIIPSPRYTTSGYIKRQGDVTAVKSLLVFNMYFKQSVSNISKA